MLLEIGNEFDVITARNLAKGFALELGFSKIDVAKIDLVIAELSNNLIKHAVDGRLMFYKRKFQGRVAFEAISLDSGPGIDNLQQAFRLGYSTKGSLGLGLHSIQEVMDEFSISSRVGTGTLIVVRKWKK